MENTTNTSNRAVPTGCYKCGRPGHWSRDCPSDPTQNPNPNPTTSGYTNSAPRYPPSTSKFKTHLAPASSNIGEKPEKPKKLPRSRPKLTPELLLSDDGLGYVLRYFPRHFKYRGRGNEVRDLGHLLGMYKEWHNHLIPYYSFDQFVHRVEKVATSKQVKRCFRELKERVANGGDPTKLHEPPTEHDIPNNEQEMRNMEVSNQNEKDASLKNSDADDIQADLFDEIYEEATEASLQNLQNDAFASAVPDVHKTVEEAPHPSCKDGTSMPTGSGMSEEQKARMEANRVKALEKAAARGRSKQSAGK